MIETKKNKSKNYSDIFLLSFFENNLELNIPNIAKLLEVEEQYLRKRIAKLSTEKTIVDYRIIVNPYQLGFQSMAFLYISCHRPDIQFIFSQLNKIPELIESYHISGQYSILSKIVCENNESLTKIINKIYEIEGVSNINSSVCFGQHVSRKLLQQSR